MARKPRTATPQPAAPAPETKAQKAGHVAAGKTLHARHVAELKKLNQQRAKHGLPPLQHIPSGTAVSGHKGRKLVAPKEALISATGGWMMAYNDEADTCVAAAIANSLLVCTGQYMDDVVLLELCKATEGATIYQGLVTLAAFGLDISPRWFASVYPIRTLGLIFGIQMAEGPHAVAVGPRGLITWGSEMQLTDYVVEEAWLIGWPAKEKS